MQIKIVVKYGSLKVIVFLKQCLLFVDWLFIVFCNLFQNGEIVMYIVVRNG